MDGWMAQAQLALCPSCGSEVLLGPPQLSGACVLVLGQPGEWPARAGQAEATASRALGSARVY